MKRMAHRQFWRPGDPFSLSCQEPLSQRSRDFPVLGQFPPEAALGSARVSSLAPSSRTTVSPEERLLEKSVVPPSLTVKTEAVAGIDRDFRPYRNRV